MTTADSIVIGAGVIGTSIAHQLARSGRGVVVLDKGSTPGAGSSSASSAIIRFTYSTLAGTLAAWESAALWAGLREHLDAPDEEVLPRLHRTGLAMLDAPSVPTTRILTNLATVGVPFEWWDARELARRVPGIETGAFYPPQPVDSEEFFADPVGDLRALFTPDAGFVDDPRLACAAFARAARRHGAELALGRRVVAIAQEADGTWTVTTDDGDVWSTPVLVNAAGPWSSAVNALAGVTSQVPTRPLRAEVHAVPAPPGLDAVGGDVPCIADPDLGTYLRPELGGGLLVGGMEPACDPLEWVDDPDAVSPERTAAGFERQVTRAARRLPALQIPTRPTGITGVYDVTPDWAPVYDRTDRDGFYVAIGTSGNQFKNAPLVGQLMAGLIRAVEDGHDHDTRPVQHRGRRTGLDLDLGAFSRLRPLDRSVTSVLG